MAQVMLVNPSPRPSKRKSKPKRKKVMAKKRRTAKQRAATKKLVALNRRRSNPSHKRKRRTLSLSAPRTRTRTRTVTKYRTRRAPVRRRALRRNPARPNIINSMIMPAVSQASGALLLDVVMGYGQGFLPMQLTTGPAKALVKGAVAIGMGMVVGRFTKRKMGKDMALGALTVTLHDLARSTLEQAAPMIPLGDMDYGNNMGIYDSWGNTGLGAYVGVGTNGNMNGNQPTGVAPQFNGMGNDPGYNSNGYEMGAYVDSL